MSLKWSILYQVTSQSNMGKSNIYSTTLPWNYLQNKLTEYNFLLLTPRSLKTLLVNFLCLNLIAKLNRVDQVVTTKTYFEYESLHIHRRHR